MGLRTISTFRDPNSHGAGFLEASQTKVYSSSLAVTLFGDLSLPDESSNPIFRTLHDAPASIEGSLKVFIQNRGVHRRIIDKRACGAVTVPLPGAIQKVFAG